MFSIVITTYNASSTIAETLESVFNQTCRLYELIVVDDGSTDDTVQIVKNFIASGKDIRLFLPGRLGRAKALNYGCGKAINRWVAIIDADDLWHSRKLELYLKSIEKNRGVDVWCSSIKTFTDVIPVDDLIGEDVGIRYLHLIDLVRYNHINHSSAVIRRDLVDYDNSRLSQIDYELWLRLSQDGCVIAIIDEKLAYHRIHSQQAFEGKVSISYRLRAVRLAQDFAWRNRFFGAFIWLPLFYGVGYVRQLTHYLRK